jgi:hypothetical protein
MARRSKGVRLDDGQILRVGRALEEAREEFERLGPTEAAEVLHKKLGFKMSPSSVKRISHSVGVKLDPLSANGQNPLVTAHVKIRALEEGLRQLRAEFEAYKSRNGTLKIGG